MTTVNPDPLSPCGPLLRCWHEQAASLATAVERSGGARGWAETLAAFAHASEALDSRELRVAVRGAARAARVDRVRFARALRGAATRTARRGLDPAAAAA